MWNGMLVIQAVLLIASIPFHIPHIDEPILGDQAFRYHETGVPHSFIYAGISHEESHLMVRHWLYVAVQRNMIDLLGFSLITLRLFSILCGTLLCLSIFYYQKSTASVTQALCTVSILIMIPQFFYYFKIG